jgi:hypothetical protein
MSAKYEKEPSRGQRTDVDDDGRTLQWPLFGDTDFHLSP